MKRYLVLFICALLLLPSLQVLAQTTQAIGTVTAWYLNVRVAPFASAERITTVSRGYTTSVIGRNADASWYQINLGSGTGWVNASYLAVTNSQTVPITYAITPPITPLPVSASAYVNVGALHIRSVPSPFNNVPLTFIVRNTVVTLVGRNLDASWYQVVLANGVSGWARSQYLTVTAGNVDTLPITSQTTNPSEPYSTVYAQGIVNTGALNIRRVPAFFGNIPITFVYQGTRFNILGRNADSSWYYVQTEHGTVGWARSRYITIISGTPANAPIVG